jgi:hypothetical protein
MYLCILVSARINMILTTNPLISEVGCHRRIRLPILVGRIVPLEGKEPAGLPCAQLHYYSVSESDQGRGTSLG